MIVLYILLIIEVLCIAAMATGVVVAIAFDDDIGEAVVTIGGLVGWSVVVLMALWFVWYIIHGIIIT